MRRAYTNGTGPRHGDGAFGRGLEKSFDRQAGGAP
jgi:hypothetical protein